MKRSILLDRYPVFTLEITKEEARYKTIAEMIEYLKSKVVNHKIAQFIAIFDQYKHTKNIGGKINPEILDAQSLIFCFGAGIPNTKILAVRPRSIGICELEDKFIVEFLEAPNEELHSVMEDWAKSIAKSE